MQAGPCYFAHYGGMATSLHINGGLRYVPPVRTTIQFDTLSLAIILPCTFCLNEKQVSERKETVWSPSSSVPDEPRETCPDAR